VDAQLLGIKEQLGIFIKIAAFLSLACLLASLLKVSAHVIQRERVIIWKCVRLLPPNCRYRETPCQPSQSTKLLTRPLLLPLGVSKLS
jgi:hypothetical protein